MSLHLLMKTHSCDLRTFSHPQRKAPSEQEVAPHKGPPGPALSNLALDYWRAGVMLDPHQPPTSPQALKNLQCPQLWKEIPEWQVSLSWQGDERWGFSCAQGPPVPCIPGIWPCPLTAVYQTGPPHLHPAPWAPLTISSVQLSHSVMSDSLQPPGLQHTRPPCPSQAPRTCSNSCPLSQ